MTGTEFKTSIETTYKSVDGWHVFMSDELPGLYVASRDLDAAYRDVAPSIQALLKLDEGVDCTVSPEVSLAVFLASVRGVDADFDDLPLTSRRFGVFGCHA